LIDPALPGSQALGAHFPFSFLRVALSLPLLHDLPQSFSIDTYQKNKTGPFSPPPPPRYLRRAGQRERARAYNAP
jgi:hypothetical protein